MNDSRAEPNDALRLRRLTGVLGALTALGLVVYPAGAYPLRSLVFYALTAAAALGTAVAGAARGRRPPWPVLAGALVGLWAAARWWAMDIRAPGRELVLGHLWLAMGLAAGAGWAAMEQATDDAGAPGATAFRRVWALAAVGFGVWALLQYWLLYPRAYAELAATLHGPPQDLQTQSLLHALRERRVGGPVGNPNLFAALLAVAALFALSLIERGERRRWQAIGTLGAVLCLAGAALTRSRGGALAMAVTLGLAAVALRGTRLRQAGAAALTATLVWVTLPEASAAEGWLRRLSDVATIRERLYYWTVAWRVGALQPWIGAGPGSFELYYLQFKPDPARESQYAHSWLFQDGAELGVVGLVLWAALAWGIARAVWRSRPPWRAAASREAWWAGCAALVLLWDGLYEFTLQWREFLTLMGWFAGLALTLAAPPASSRSRKRALAAWLPSAVGGLLALAWTPPWHLARAQQLTADDAAWAGHWAAVEVALARALHWLPDDAGLWLARARALERLGRRDEAWQALATADQLNPRSAAVAAAAAEWLAAQGRTEEALARLAAAIDRFPGKADYYLQRASLNLALGRLDAARADLQAIEERRLPLWEFQLPRYDALCERAGLPVRGDAH